MNDLAALAAELERTAELLRRAGEPRWADGLDGLGARCRADRPRDVVGDVLGLHAGMGSFSDLVLQDEAGVRPEQAELDRRRDAIFELARSALA